MTPLIRKDVSLCTVGCSLGISLLHTCVVYSLCCASPFLSKSLPDGSVTEPDMSASFCPDHKAPMVLFLDRVYGIEDQSFLLQLLEVGFLPDLRAATSLDTVGKAGNNTGEVIHGQPQ